jgi:hypothetical protein
MGIVVYFHTPFSTSDLFGDFSNTRPHVCLPCSIFARYFSVIDLFIFHSNSCKFLLRGDLLTGISLLLFASSFFYSILFLHMFFNTFRFPHI